MLGTRVDNHQHSCFLQDLVVPDFRTTDVSQALLCYHYDQKLQVCHGHMVEAALDLTKTSQLRRIFAIDLLVTIVCILMARRSEALVSWRSFEWRMP